VQLRERLSGSYTLELQLLSDDDQGDPLAMLGKNASLRFMRDDLHCVHGVVAEVTVLGGVADARRVALKVRPALSALAFSSTSRIFSDRSAPEVAREVLEHALRPFQRTVELDLLRDDYPVLEYLAQHRETNLTFIQRILAEHGLWYYFQHPTDEGAVEVLIITDSPLRAPKGAEPPEVELVLDRESPDASESVASFGASVQLATSSLELLQYDWTHPERRDREKSTDQASALPVLHGYEHGDVVSLDYNEAGYRKHDTARQARLRLEQARVRAEVFHGRSNVTWLRPGHYMQLDGRAWLLVSVTHGGALDKEGGKQARGHYWNAFTCLPREVPYRAPRVNKPRILGPQLATVVDRVGSAAPPKSGLDGDDIVADNHGRVRVRFPWDLTPARQGGGASCWLRVAQMLAGPGWGTQFLPRVGMEVIVEFIDGDPDRPIITGTLCNGLNAPPFAEAAHSGIKSRSTSDPSGFNEWRFVDACEQEQVVVRAQRDYAEKVLRNHSTTVYQQQTQSVGGNQSETVGMNQSLVTQGRHKAVGGNDVHVIKQERSTFVAKRSGAVFNDANELTVEKATRSSYLGTHTRGVTGTQTLRAEEDKLEHVAGRLELTTDTAHTLRQGKTVRTYQDGKLSLNCGDTLSMVRGPASITTDATDNVVVSTPGTLTLQAGASKIVISASGVELTAPKIDIKVAASSLALNPATATLSSTNTTIEASASCQVRGLALLTLN